MAHRIRRQRWEVHAADGGEGEALALRTTLRAGLERALQPAIERAFASVDAEGQVVHVPRLEVRLTLPARADDVLDALPALLERAVAEELRLLIDREQQPADPARRAPSILARTVAEERVATLLHYLRTGALPWTAAPSGASSDGDALRGALAERAAEVVEAMAAAPARREHWFRLLQLASGGDAWPALAAALSARLGAGWERVVLLLSLGGPAMASGAIAPSRHARLGVAAALLEHAARGSRPEAAIAATFVALRSADERRALAPLVAAVVTPDDARFAVAPAIPAAGDRRAGHAPVAERAIDAVSPGGAAPAGPTSPRAPAASGTGLVAVVAGLAGDGRDVDVSAADRPSAGDDRLLAVASAGLVLLHPYIPRLFAHIGLAADDEIVDGGLARAAALLHFIATGRDEPLELELGVVKLLLGLAPDDALPVGGGLLSDDDMVEAQALLEAVIEHWSVLKRTSVPGLRGSFLQRPGLCRRAEGEHGWALHVEPMAIDVLLDHLPWGISVVRLPWMRDTIYTEWTTR